eukprot:m.139351 g.139351  ORF g.139351 m.139351 type:complete len:350 (-) comp17621_c0_seq1:52-1101(-)
MHSISSCEVTAGMSLPLLWASLTLLVLLSQVVLCGGLFYLYYVNPTYQQWQFKTKQEYPTPSMVKSEIVGMLKSVFAVPVCPAIAIYQAQLGISKGYCGSLSEHGYIYLLISFVGIFLVSDLFQWTYHFLGHKVESMWKNHKQHHRHFNPTPFGVLADEAWDHLLRAAPMVLIPMVVPCNIDLIFFIYLTFFYIYGILLHWGYEFDFGCATQHRHWFTPYEHNLHHSVSTRNKCYHAGFFLKLWDRLAGTEYNGTCMCAHCSRKAGLRTQQCFNKIIVPDYSVLLSPLFWMGQTEQLAASSETYSDSSASEMSNITSAGWCDSWRDDIKLVLQLRRMSTDSVVSCLNGI